MNNYTIDQKSVVDSMKAVNTATNVRRKLRNSIPEGSILEKLTDFAFSIPDFRRTDKGNIRHGLGDIIMLMIFARMSKCAGRADMIEFGRRGRPSIPESRTDTSIRSRSIRECMSSACMTPTEPLFSDRSTLR